MMPLKFLIGCAAFFAPAASAQQPAAPQRTAPAPAADVPATAPAPAVAPAQPAPAPATSPAQVAEIVAREFPAYDRNRDGALDAGEFGEWMLKLRTIADPASTANADANRTWVNAAFSQADADKSRSLTLGELTGFLQQG